ncbi:F-box/LRR-repeat protein [Carex littledalei]|uniref:F-box/LRR-repeat protein n=1 Tax=Carex littledalei TaxID=544730 RepID=A0A833VH14_9POAL|nr:F-box/LRR-repeat protein [Carex littledalei]
METDQNQAAMKPTLATDQGEEQQDLDYISCLPDETLHGIISKLEIRDAAVTTAVSKRWAPLFPTLPSLKIVVDSFLDSSFNFDPFDDDDYDSYNDYYMKNKMKWVDSLISVLDSRKTAVKKFDIAVPMRELDADVFDPFFSIVCCSGVEDLSIFNTGPHSCNQTPSPVFSCNTIVKLKIRSCRLVVPSKLTGLRSVKSLVLKNVTVADDDLQRLISWCKAMEKLSIIDCFMVKNIVICAPNLSELVISLGWPVGVVLKSVPRLVSMEISFDSISNTSMKCCYGCLEDKEKGSDIDEETDDEETDDEETDDEEIDGGFSVSNSEKTFEGTNEATNLMDILNGLRRLKDLHLTFSDDYRMIFSKDGMALPNCYLVELKKLCLCFPFDYNDFNISISCLLNSSPHLMEIIICVDKYSDYSPIVLELNFWEKKLSAECVKHHLTTATFYLPEDCFGFPKFLLRNAGSLKNMNIFYYGKLKPIPNTTEQIKKELFAIQMASPDVEIMVKPIISSYKHIASF